MLENTVKDHNADTIYIFGHSKVGERVTGSSKDLLELRDYFTAMLDFAQKGIAAGKSKEEIVKWRRFRASSATRARPRRSRRPTTS